jgi:pilus assembly protein TadC
MIKIPDAKIIKIGKAIDKDILFAGKFMIIELKSGISLYQVLNNIAENYEGIGKHFKRIVQDIDLGTETLVAINNAILRTPSDNLRKVLWQLSNSIKTGIDVSTSLDTVLTQISKNQMIEVEKYGKKLNPIATFYLMLAVIIPSLGMVMGVVMASFLNFTINIWGFTVIAVSLSMFQLMFYGIIKVNRPSVEM